LEDEEGGEFSTHEIVKYTENLREPEVKNYSGVSRRWWEDNIKEH
jgi:hypothetical protein